MCSLKHDPGRFSKHQSRGRPAGGDVLLDMELINMNRPLEMRGRDFPTKRPILELVRVIVPSNHAVFVACQLRIFLTTQMSIVKQRKSAGHVPSQTEHYLARHTTSPSRFSRNASRASNHSCSLFLVCTTATSPIPNGFTCCALLPVHIRLISLTSMNILLLGILMSSI